MRFSHAFHSIPVTEEQRARLRLWCSAIYVRRPGCRLTPPLSLCVILDYLGYCKDQGVNICESTL